jgi:hypothetical protein
MAAPGLAKLGNPDAGYVHRDKFVEPGEAVALPTAILKWYDLARSDTPVEPDVRDLGRRFLEREGDAGRLDLGGDLGFAVLHRCGGAGFYFLLVSTWRNENELWESVFAKDDAAAPDFRTYPFTTAHRGTYCVWELGAVWHEQQAWRRYLLSSRDEAAKRAYLADHYRGPV